MVNRKKKQKSVAGKPEVVETWNNDNTRGYGMGKMKRKIEDKAEDKKAAGVIELEGMSETVVKKRKRGADREMAEAFFLSPEMGSSRLRPRKDVPSFRRVLLSVNDFDRIVGKRVKVFWPDSRRWFSGHIKSFDNEKKVHTVFYDDGDKENLDVMQEQFELQILPSEAFTILSRSEPNRDMAQDDTQVVGHPAKSKGLKISEATTLEKTEDSEPVKKYARMERKPSKATKRRLPKLQGGKDIDGEGNLTLDTEDRVSEKIELKMVTDEINMDKTVSAQKRHNEAEPHSGKKELGSDGSEVSGESAKVDATEVNDVKPFEKKGNIKRKKSSKMAKKGKSKPKVKRNTEDEKTEHSEDIEADVLPEIVDKKKTVGKFTMEISEDIGYGKDQTGFDSKQASDGSKETSEVRCTQTNSLNKEEDPEVLCKQKNESLEAAGFIAELGGKDILEEGREAEVQGSQSLAGKQNENIISMASQETASDGGPDAKASDSQPVSDVEANKEENLANVESQEDPGKKMRGRAKSRK